MGRYRVFYFEDLARGEVIIGCPVCEKLERNFIEPVAVILEKGNYEKFEGQLEKIKSLEELKENKELFEKILNKDDLVCILHQNKEGKHWEEDTEEFKEWNSKILNLANKDRLTDKDIEGLNKDNIIYQFWCRVRAYRFAVDYKSLWEEVGHNWESFKGKIKSKIDLEEIEKIEKDRKILKLYLKKGNWVGKSGIYDFRKIRFPLFFNYASLTEKENENWKTKINLNFWYKNQILAFQNKADFSGATFQDEANFIEAMFQNTVIFEDVEFYRKTYFEKSVFQKEVVFFRSEFKDKAYFKESIFQNIAYFQFTIFREKTHFDRTIFQNEVNFSISIFQYEAYFDETTFGKKVYFISCKIANFVLKNISILNETYFKISNCEFVRFELENFTNHTDNFLISNIVLDSGFIKESKKIKKEKLKNILTLYKFGKNKEGRENFINKLMLEANIPISKTFSFYYDIPISISISKTFYYEEFSQIPLKEGIKIREITKLLSLTLSLNINNCVLNKMKFINCDFSQAERITIKNSFIEDISFNNIDWGEITENRINPKLFKEDPKSARESYRQVKHALDKHSDHINANWFYALEMRAYERYLKTLNWKDHFQEKLVFSIHKFISEFGISWVRPLVLIVLSTIIMLGFGIKLFPIEKIENETSTTIFGFVMDKFYYVAPLWNIDFWVIYIALATIGIYFYFYLIWKTNGVKLEKKEIGYEDAGFTFKAFNINSYKILTSLFFIALPIYIIGLLWLYSGNSLTTAVFEFLDRFATTLNIFKVFSHFVGEDSSLHKLYSGYLFLYKIYAIFILVLIYQLILAIRRRVRR